VRKIEEFLRHVLYTKRKSQNQNSRKKKEISLFYDRLRLADLANQVLAIDGVSLLNLEARDLSTVRGGDDHFLG